MEKVLRALTPVAMFLVMLAPGLPGLAVAQGLPGTQGDAADVGRTVNVAPASSFEQLSPGSRMIAKSLSWAQGESDLDTGPVSRGARWTLEKISAARLAGLSWGEVFLQMKADRLITARTLGEVVNGYYRPVPVSTPVSASSETSTGPGGTSSAPDITRMDTTTGSSRGKHE
jgi:hypothetical protein